MTTGQAETVMQASWILRRLRVPLFRQETVNDLAEEIMRASTFDSTGRVGAARAELRNLRDHLNEEGTLEDRLLALALEGVIALLMTV